MNQSDLPGRLDVRVDRNPPTGFSRVAQRTTERTGSGIAVALIVGAFGIWLLVGIWSGFPRWWELVATVGVSFFTLLMLVLIQHTQNHDDRATQLKLDELIRATRGATNRMMTLEDASHEDLERIREDYRAQAEAATPRE